MRTFHAAALAAMLAMLAMLVSSSASADPRGLVGGYLQRNGLPQAKPVQVTDLSGQQRERLCVPVTRASLRDFLSTFGEANGCLVAVRPRKGPYVKLAFSPERLYMSTADKYGPGPRLTDYGKISAALDPERDPRFVVLGLEAGEIKHWGTMLDTYHNTTDRYLNKQRYMQDHKLSALFADCMWWFVHGETGSGVNIATRAGVRRSRAPENLVAKLAQEGNGCVAVVGVGVTNGEQFTALPRESLLPPKLREVY